MELVLVPSMAFFQAFRVNMFEVSEVEGAFRVNTLVDSEEFTILFGYKGVAAIGTDKAGWHGHVFTVGKCFATYFT